jgi:Co/Zn/Cd efflux system component
VRRNIPKAGRLVSGRGACAKSWVNREGSRGRNSLADVRTKLMDMAASSSKKSLYAALIGNILVAVTKIGAALWTGSSAMTSEAIHSVVDTSNEIPLLYGYHRASRPPDRLHPLG